MVAYLAEEFTIAPMRRLIKKFADIKISEEAAEEMRRMVGIYASEVAKAAVDNAQRDNRRTLLERDIKAAVRRDLEKVDH
ncbi:NFYB/HAP3 family transcription factor subunit [Candidatus Bathyarchaeota archaeon]|nr:NFYB/HAP3 family transcription factor subunit [Candidatus Bathyarchaeota archaeon]